MRYDFTKIIDRHGKDAIAVDGLGKNPGFAPEPPKDGFDVIPMWVADMNFETVPTIPKAIMDRAAHPAYGYFSPVEEYYDSIIRWHKIRNNERVRDIIRYFSDFYEDFDEKRAYDMLGKLQIDASDRLKTMSKGTKKSAADSRDEPSCRSVYFR